MHTLANNGVVDVKKRINEMLPACLDGLEQIIEDPEASYSIKSKVYFDLLDRAGHGAPTKLESTHSHLH